MVTRGDLFPARFAIDGFQAQDYAPRELVIVADTLSEPLRAHITALADPSIRLLEVPAAPLGALRNSAVAAASGALVAQWDDDDLHAPTRLSAQYAALTAMQVDAVLLQRWMLWWPARYRLAISHRRAWEGSMLAKRAKMLPYPAIALAEDSAMLNRLAQTGRLGLIDRPELYCYIYHGRNAWPSAHFEGLYQAASVRFEFAAYAPALAQLGAMPIDAYRAALDA